MTAITDKNLRDKLMEEKKPEMKKTIEMNKQNTYEKKNDKNTIPEALISNREKEIKEEPIQRMDNSTHDRERNSTTTDLVNSVTHQTGAQPTNAQHSIRHAITAGRRATWHGHADKEKTTKTNYGP